MGWITKRNLRTGTHLAKNAKVGKRAGVLRKIVGTMVIEGMEYEQLECGHKGRFLLSVGASGMFGTQTANSRKCMECKNQINE